MDETMTETLAAGTDQAGEAPAENQSEETSAAAMTGTLLQETESSEQSEGDGQKDTQNGAEGEKEAPTDPEQYELNIPEKYGDEARGVFVEMAKDLGLSQEQTQKMIDRYGAEMGRQEQIRLEARNAQVLKWHAELKNDPEFGGQNFGANVEYYRRGVRHIDPKGELTAILEQSGYGSHPVVVKAIAQIGREVGEDRIIGRGVTSDDRSLADRYYKDL